MKATRPKLWHVCWQGSDKVVKLRLINFVQKLCICYLFTFQRSNYYWLIEWIGETRKPYRTDIWAIQLHSEIWPLSTRQNQMWVGGWTGSPATGPPVGKRQGQLFLLLCPPQSCTIKNIPKLAKYFPGTSYCNRFASTMFHHTPLVMLKINKILGKPFQNHAPYRLCTQFTLCHFFGCTLTNLSVLNRNEMYCPFLAYCRTCIRPHWKSP